MAGDPNKPLSSRPKMDRDEWKKFCNKINEVGKYLHDHNMPLAYHHHMGTVIETEEETTRLLENTDEKIKLILDTGHMLFAGGSSIKILNDYKERIIHIHCKDMRKDILKKSLERNWSFRQAFLEGAFTVPGDGCIDYLPLIRILKKNNYFFFECIISSTNEALMIPVGIATTPIPTKEIIEAKIFPPTVMGITSP